MNKQDINRESICALADGQLAGEAFAAAVQLAHSDADARKTWQSYHLVGDVLRSQDLARCTLGDSFVSKLQTRLQKEAALSTSVKPPKVVQRYVAAVPGKPVAANDAAFRWKMVAGFASLVAVGAVGWGLLGSVGAGNSSSPSLALVPPTNAPANLGSAESAAPMVMIRDPNLDALLAAHKQFGNGSALQGSTGFLRNATFEGSAR